MTTYKIVISIIAIGLFGVALAQEEARGGDMAAPVKGGTMIVTPKPVDEATQQAIRSLLEAAGHGSEVHFVDHESRGAGPHHVKVVKKVEVVSD
jgi:hypothetical protein